MATHFALGNIPGKKTLHPVHVTRKTQPIPLFPVVAWSVGYGYNGANGDRTFA
jgi:hypothetical protein